MKISEMIDGDAFEHLARRVPGLLYCDTHNAAKNASRIGALSAKCSLLTHNSDGGIVAPGTPTREYDIVWENIPQSITHWFAQNVDVRDERLTPIPIGLERERWYPHLHKKETLFSLTEPKSKHLCYLNVNTSIRVQREELYGRFGHVSWCTAERGRNGVDFERYANQLISHKFVLCPDGNGIDTHRVWETLYAGSYPIVERHVCMEEFSKILPILVIDSWDQVTEEFLEWIYPEMRAYDWNTRALTMSYWEELIRSKL